MIFDVDFNIFDLILTWSSVDFCKYTMVQIKVKLVQKLKNGLGDIWIFL